MSQRPPPFAALAPVHVIVNASAGQGCGPEWLRALEDKFLAHGMRASVAFTHSGDEILQAAQEAAGADQAAVRLSPAR